MWDLKHDRVEKPVFQYSVYYLLINFIFVFVLKGHTTEVSALAIDFTEKFIASGSESGELFIFGIPSPTPSLRYYVIPKFFLIILI
jgi:hypothetical protein